MGQEKWERERQREEEEQKAKEAARALIVEGKVRTAEEIRKKKGHYVLEVTFEEDGQEESVNIVCDKDVQEGSLVKVALEGALIPGRSAPVEAKKVAGEYSEGELLEVLAAPAAPAETEPAEETID